MRIIVYFLISVLSLSLSAQELEEVAINAVVEYHSTSDTSQRGKGKIHDWHFTVPYLNNVKRTVRVYTPPTWTDKEKLPVLYLHDGQNIFYDSTSFVGEWFVDETLDSLYKTNGFRCIVVAIDHLGVDRMREYNPWDNDRFGKGLGRPYIDWIVEELKPFIDRNYNTLSDAKHTAILGASVGGTISHYALLTYPNVFGNAGIYSPSYWISHQELLSLSAEYEYENPIKAVLLMGSEGRGNLRRAKKQYKTLKEQSTVNPIFVYDENGSHNETLWSRHFADTVVEFFTE